MNIGVYGSNILQGEGDVIVVRRVNIVESIESHLHVAGCRLMHVCVCVFSSSSRGGLPSDAVLTARQITP